MSSSNVTLTGPGTANIQALVTSLVDRAVTQQSTANSAQSPTPAPVITSITVRG